MTVLNRDSTPEDLGVDRQFVWIQGGGEPLAAWLHRASDGAGDNAPGLLICSPLGHEFIHAHQSVREIADSFARAGYVVLRFDYTGTGDSGGDEFTEAIVAAWQQDIRVAASYLASVSPGGLRQILAIRSGALLAASVAKEIAPVDGLMLWDPILAGLRLIRELRANEKMAYFRCSPDLLESVGFPYPTPMLSALKPMQVGAALEGSDFPVVALVRDTAPVAAGVEKLGDVCKQFESVQLPGLADMLTEPHNAVIPHRAIEETLARARSLLSVQTARSVDAEFEAASHGKFAAGVIESVHRVSESGGTGVLCYSPENSTGDRPIVLMGNAGSIFHIGPNRLYVTLARQLAKSGFASFRYDLPNMGDGLRMRHAEANYPYPADAVEKISEVIEFARQTLGYSTVVLTGFCSGATQAFLAALEELPSSALIETAMVNPKVFYVEDIPEYSDNHLMHRANYYSRAVGDKDRWRRLLTGKIDYRRLISYLFRRGGQQILEIGKKARRMLSGAPSTRLGRDLVRYAGTGRQLSFFFSSRDPGLRVLLESSDGIARKYIDEGRLPVTVIEDADHTMIALRCREDFSAKFTAYLGERYPET